MLTNAFKDEPWTFNDEFNVVLLFNIVNPETFDVDNMVVLFEVKVFELYYLILYYMR